MGELVSYFGNQVGGGVAIDILLEIVAFLIAIWILYAVIKSAVKNAIVASRKELDYIIRKALLESKADIESGMKGIPDYAVLEYQHKDDEEKTHEQEERAEWEYGRKRDQEPKE